MAETLTTIHSLFQYVALLGVAIGVVSAIRSQPADAPPFTVATWAIRIQVVLGILVWLASAGWGAGLIQGWIHPVAGIGALGAVEAMTARARREQSSRPILVGYVIAAVLVVAAIGLAEAA